MEGVPELLFVTLFQLVVTWIMAGIMWFAQVVHYPLYTKIKEGFVEYERSHIRRAALLIGPLMLLEVVTAIILIGITPEGALTKFAGANLLVLMLIWISTFLFQITQHQKLRVRFSKKSLQGLLTSNWIRTLLWTIKGAVMAAMTYTLF
ncbi:MAG: hypothetical protein K1060chlam2_01409 [Chlamydiae bacterium]|nr:hypothetical protein [Chlamydiota bacterium]